MPLIYHKNVIITQKGYKMRRKLLFVLLAVCALLSACGNATVSITETIKEYEAMSYGEYKEKTGNEAAFYHGSFFIGEIPDASFCVIYSGEYDEEMAAAILKDGDMPIRIEGTLSDLMTGIKEEMSLAELAKALSKGGKLEAAFEVLEGGGTAYYVGDKYALISFDNDKDGAFDRTLLLSLDDASGETIGPETVAWLERL